MLTSSPSPATVGAHSPSSSARLNSLRRKKPSHHTRRPPPSRSLSMFSSLKSLVTSPFSWFANATTDSFESEDTPGKRKLIHGSSNSYETEGDQQHSPSAHRVKRIRLHSPVPVSAPIPAPYLDPPTPVLRPSTHSRTHASKPARHYHLSNNNILIPRPDTSRLSPNSFNPPPRTQAAPVARTMSMDPPKASRPFVPELSLPPPISRDVSMEYSPSLATQPANPPFRMRSALTPQPGAPLYGPNPQRRERNPSEPPPLTALIENPIFVKPPPVPPEQRRAGDDSSTTLGSLVGAQKSSLPANRSHSTLVLPAQSTDGLRPTNAAELAFQQLERYRTPLVLDHLGSANPDVTLPELFQARKKARALVLMKRDKRDEKPRLGHASKYINAPKEKDKDTPSKTKNSKPYSGEGGLKKLLARRKQEVMEKPESPEDPDAQAMVDDSELEPAAPKHTSKIAEPVRTPATFARKVSAPPPPSTIPSFGVVGVRKPASFRAKHTQGRSVGPTRTRNRFTAAYEDDEPDCVDDVTTMPEEEFLKDKDGISTNLPKFEPPSGFSFAPPSVISIPQAPDSSIARDEPPISALPFTFPKVQTPPVITPAPVIVAVAAPQPPTITFVPPTPDRPQAEKGPSGPTLPDFFANSQILARTGVAPPHFVSKPVSPPEPEPPAQAVDDAAAVGGSVTGAAVPGPSAASVVAAAPPTPSQPPSLESEKATPPTPAPAPFLFGPPPPAQPTLASSTQPSNSSPLPFSLTPSSAMQLGGKKDGAIPAQPKSLFGGATTTFPGFGASVSNPTPGTKSVSQSEEAATPAFSFPKVVTPAPAESAEPLKPAFTLQKSPALTSTSVPGSGSVPAAESSKAPSESVPFSFDQPTKESSTAASSTPAKKSFTFAAPSTTPSTVEKPAVASTGFTFGPTTTTPAGTPSGFLFGSPAAQSQAKPATSTEGFSIAKPVTGRPDASKPAFSFGTSMPARPLTPPPADDGMRMEESPTRGGGMDVNGGSAKPQSLPQLLMPGTPKASFSFGTSTGTGFGSPLPSPFGANSGSGFTFGQQSQTTSQGTTGGFSFSTNTKAPESASGGFSFAATKPAENATSAGFKIGASTTDGGPSSSSGFAFGQSGPKTADATSSGFSFKAPEPIQHSTSFTFGQAAPEPALPSSSGFAFGQTQAQQPASTTSFGFGSPASGGAFGSAPASPAFGTQTLAPPSSTPFSFGGPTSAPLQQPASNPFGFGSSAGQPTSPAVQQGFGFNLAGGTPQTPTAPFGASTPLTPTSGSGSGGSAIFTMGATPPQAAPPGARPVKKLPTRRNANVKR